MKLSTAEYLRTVKIQNDGGNVLDQARRILSGKINDRLGAEASVHDISQSVFEKDILIHLAGLYGVNKENRNEAIGKNFFLGIKLALLKLQIFSILDTSDARKVWRNILTPQGLQKIRENESRFFCCISYGPDLLLSALLENDFLPPELACVFPMSCIVDDFNKGILPTSPVSNTYFMINIIQREIERAQSKGNTTGVESLQSQLGVIQDNIRRYF